MMHPAAYFTGLYACIRYEAQLDAARELARFWGFLTEFDEAFHEAFTEAQKDNKHDYSKQPDPIAMIKTMLTGRFGKGVDDE